MNKEKLLSDLKYLLEEAQVDERISDELEEQYIAIGKQEALNQLIDAIEDGLYDE